MISLGKKCKVQFIHTCNAGGITIDHVYRIGNIAVLTDRPCN